MTIPVHLLVEGVLDEVVGRRIVADLGGVPGVVYGKRGFGYIRSKIAGFNRGAVHVPMLALVDFMDTRAECPPSAAREWLPKPEAKMVFRLAVPEIEGWLLADRKGVASFLGVPIDKVPLDPEGLSDPKQTLVNLARRSRRNTLREALVPHPGTSAVEGPRYTSELAKFVSNDWDLEAAREVSPSLRTCLERLGGVVGSG